MEKFSQWRDPATGIAPFIPVADRSQNNLVGLGKCIFLIPLVLLLHVGSLILSLPTFHLYLSNVTSIIVEYAIGDNKWRKKGTSPRPGDVIFSNFVSPADPLVYLSIVKTTFVIPAGASTHYVPLSSSQVQKAALLTPSELSKFLEYNKASAVPLEKLVSAAKSNGSVVVIFPESTTSNGKGLLKFTDIPIGDLGSSSRIFPSAIKYNPSNLMSPISGTSLLSWRWKVVARWETYNARVRIGLPISSDQISLNTVAQRICEAGKMTQVGFSGSDKEEFLAAWNTVKR